MDYLSSFIVVTLGPALTVELSLLVGFLFLVRLRSLLYAALWRR